MELINIDNQENDDRNPISVLEGDEFCIGRILARESSVGQSSRVFYRATEGVPFKWEMQPGTPKNIPHQPEVDDDNILPICPSPLMQSLRLPLPNVTVHQVDHDTKEYSAVKKSKIWSLRKIGKKVETLIGSSSSSSNNNNKTPLESSRFGEYSSSFCSDSSSSSSPSSSFSSNSRVVDTSAVDDGPFCCGPLNVVLDEGKKGVYYCSKHKKAFAIEDNELITPAAAGVLLRWEAQPGTPKTLPENDIIPPPSPPRAVQREEAEEYSTWASRVACFTIRRKNKEKKKTGELFEFDASFRESGSVSSRSSKVDLRVSKIRRNFEGGCFSCGGYWRRKDIVVFARRKLNSYIS